MKNPVIDTFNKLRDASGLDIWIQQAERLPENSVPLFRMSLRDGKKIHSIDFSVPSVGGMSDAEIGEKYISPSLDALRAAAGS